MKRFLRYFFALNFFLLDVRCSLLDLFTSSINDKVDRFVREANLVFKEDGKSYIEIPYFENVAENKNDYGIFYASNGTLGNLSTLERVGNAKLKANGWNINIHLFLRVKDLEFIYNTLLIQNDDWPEYCRTDTFSVKFQENLIECRFVFSLRNFQLSIDSVDLVKMEGPRTNTPDATCVDWLYKDSMEDFLYRYIVDIKDIVISNIETEMDHLGDRFHGLIPTNPFKIFQLLA